MSLFAFDVPVILIGGFVIGAIIAGAAYGVDRGIHALWRGCAGRSTMISRSERFIAPRCEWALH